jgi:hypothetical protein
MNVGGPPQSTTAPTNIIIISMLTENKEDESIAARIRKAIFKIELSKEAVGVTKIFAKFIDMIVLRRNPNIVYENFIKKNFLLLKIMIVKIIFNKDKTSYEAAIANSEIL